MLLRAREQFRVETLDNAAEAPEGQESDHGEEEAVSIAAEGEATGEEATSRADNTAEEDIPTRGGGRYGLREQVSQPDRYIPGAYGAVSGNDDAGMPVFRADEITFPSILDKL